MPTSHFPRLVDTLRTPGHRRGVLVRRAIAVALLIAALASALSAAKELPRVPVFSRDLPAGAELALADVARLTLISSTPSPTPSEVPGSGVGLIGVEERANALGGKLESWGDATKFTLLAELPVQKENRV